MAKFKNAWGMNFKNMDDHHFSLILHFNAFNTFSWALVLHQPDRIFTLSQRLHLSWVSLYIFTSLEEKKHHFTFFWSFSCLKTNPLEDFEGFTAQIKFSIFSLLVCESFLISNIIISTSCDEKNTRLLKIFLEKFTTKFHENYLTFVDKHNVTIKLFLL